MVNRFLRTASTRRLLATIGGFVIAIVGGTAIAIAAQGSGPVPRPEPLAQAIHGALAAPKVQGINASISFTNHLINASELQGVDPVLSGGTGHVWISNDGQLRVELYGDNGDPEIVVNKTTWWISDPTLQTVYEGTVPARSAGSKQDTGTLPSVAQIQTYLSKLMQHVNVSRAVPTDVGGQPTYTVTVSPRHSGGLIGEAQLAWDAIEGVPLRFAVYARGDNVNPVVEIAATGVSYGPVDASVFNISPPSGYKVVSVATPAASAAAHGATGAAARARAFKLGLRGAAAMRAGEHRAAVSGVKAVAAQLPFQLVAPAKLVGLPRQSTSLLDMGGKHGALVTYGQSLGGMVVIEQPASAASTQRLNLSSGSGDHAQGVLLPTVSIHGTTAQELDTALGTVVRFTRGGVTFTVLGSVPAYAADAAARAL
jgi:outer membrane lipoprotein-sorting protein